jgi:hypothetical protein
VLLRSLLLLHRCIPSVGGYRERLVSEATACDFQIFWFALRSLPLSHTACKNNEKPRVTTCEGQNQTIKAKKKLAGFFRFALHAVCLCMSLYSISVTGTHQMTCVYECHEPRNY